MPSKSLEKAFNQIVESLKDDDVSMIGLYGMASVGKTTLVKEVANEVEVMKVFDQTSLLSSNSLRRQISFPKLTKVWIINRNKLKCVFPLSASLCLPILKEFKVEESSELEHVFRHEDESNTET
ncbi:hypothetical protein J1N35_028264 [Gossypium stocksii]|uniref:NB-ARC domain-containing protein n=1 Tax=Gossypium stocksii TaxID=47602 RepID=A0A9D3ZSC5_9ROSI|nr:hypothetical protein J1N35_028264 [Gossypium stocksii]